jgi:alkanesulfonate monooxygenase SsuD/methylene tetrahydromethanopterin reductase-like flavin-dependent oxidoreductase (luciferase family)
VLWILVEVSVSNQWIRRLTVIEARPGGVMAHIVREGVPSPGMRVGIGLPNGIPGTTGVAILEWARRADAGPFTSVGVVDRIAYDSHEPMATLAAAAGVTERVRLVTMVVIAPLRTTGVLAKEAATVDALSGGRLTLGLAVGARIEDYRAAGVRSVGRGARLEEQLADLRDMWESAPGPKASPELLVGGTSDAAFARAARYADGYVHGGGPPRAFARAADSARAAWSDLGRPGQPALWGQSYFALGSDAVERGRGYMRDYYSFTGPFAEKVAEGLLTTPQAIAGQVRGYAEAGCDELVLLPAVADPDQVERLAQVVSGL